MPSQKLTQATIQKMRTPDKRLDISDQAVRGLYLRVSPTGSKTWRLRYKINGRTTYITLGAWPSLSVADAHRKVLDAQDLLKQGIDPAAEAQRKKAERRAMPTVAEFAAEYVDRHAKPNKKSWREDKRILDREVVPEIGKIALDKVHRLELNSIIDTIKDRPAPAMANMTLAVVRRMFGFAIERGVLETSPVHNIKATPAKTRRVVLTDEGLKHLWASTAPYDEAAKPLPMHHVTRNVLRLLLLTGQRSSEVAGIELAEIELDKKRWTLPGSRTKNGLDQVVPLSDLAVDVIHDAMETAGAEHLFATNSGAGCLSKYTVVKAMERIFEGWQPRYRAHDLRRTVATRLGELGFNRLIQDKVLNHKDHSVGGIYDRYDYFREKRQALDKWAEVLKTII